MAEIPVVRLSAATRCTTEGSARRTHEAPRYEVQSGPGRDSGDVFCYPCAGKNRKTAISNLKGQRTKAANAEARAQGYTSAAAQRSAGAELFIRQRGWIALAIGAVLLQKTYWLLSGAAGLFALFFFAKRSPAPCMHLPVSCPNGAHGVLRSCADPVHRRANRAEIGALMHHLQWPAMWSDWPGRRAFVGFALAVLLAWGSLLGYLTTTRGWWVAVLADAALAAVVIGGVWLWRRRHVPR